MDDPVEVGRKLGIPPCPSCGELLGARYGPRRVCWRCAAIRPPRVHRRRPSAFETFHTRVWGRLDQLTDSPIILTERLSAESRCYLPPLPRRDDGRPDPRCGTTPDHDHPRRRPRRLFARMHGARNWRSPLSVSPITDDDADRLGKKPPKGRKTPYPPEREATLSEVREWLSNAAGLPPEVRIETVVRAGHEPEDAVTVVLSNSMKLRCSHQSRLQQARTLQSFLQSETDGIALPHYLTPAEVGDFFGQLCRLGTASSRSDPVADLHERLMMFVGLCEEIIGSIVDHAARYMTIEAIRSRPSFDRAAAQDMKNGSPEVQPIVLVDQEDGRRYVRALEWVAYLREVLKWPVNESKLVARMAELGSERVDPQAWNPDRSHKTHLVFYSLPENQ